MSEPYKLGLNEGFAVVTGAASGIGKETVFAFAEAGVEGVILADLNLSGADAVAQESKKLPLHVNFRAVPVEVDISDETAVQGMVETAVKEFGRIDYCVHSAGIGNLSGAVTENVKLDVFDKTMATNIRGTLLVVRAVSKAMAGQEPRTYESCRPGSTPRSIGRGSIVTIASANGVIAAPGMMPYTASKHAVIEITKTAALDNMKNQIRVNAVCPAWTDTPMMQASLNRVPQLGKMIKDLTPLGRGATTEEVADYILFLCSPSASYINGTSLLIDSGVTLTAHGAENL